MKKSVIVTGASAGIGRACAERLQQSGYEVVNFDIRLPEGDPEFTSMVVDLRNQQDVLTAVETIAERYRLVGLVNNAGMGVSAPLETTTKTDLLKCFELNVAALVNCTQAILPAFKKNQGGRIVNIASRAALGKKNRTAYAASKGGVISMTRVWALELAEHGITVNSIGPGPIATEQFSEVNGDDNPDTIALLKSIPLQRMGKPQDIAHGVEFFLAEEAGFITGQVIYICGGLTVGVAGI